MEMPLILALAGAYYFVFQYYRHCTIWVLLSTICLHISDAGPNESLLRFFSPFFIMLHYYALSVQSEQLELAAIVGALGFAIITSPAFKNEVVLPESRPAAARLSQPAAAPVVATAPTPMIDNASNSRRVEIITPSQPQPLASAMTPGKSILKSVRTKVQTPESTVTTPAASTGKKASNRRKSAGGNGGMDADVLDALTAAPEASTKASAAKRRTSTSSARSSSGEEVVAQARAAARADFEVATQIAANHVVASSNTQSSAAPKRVPKRRAPMPEEQIASHARAAVDAMAVDENEEDEEIVPSPKKLRTSRKRSAKLDL